VFLLRVVCYVFLFRVVCYVFLLRVVCYVFLLRVVCYVFLLRVVCFTVSGGLIYRVPGRRTHARATVKDRFSCVAAWNS